MLTAIDAVESWLVLLPTALQIPLLLLVLLPLCWLVSRAIDPVVEWILVRAQRYVLPVRSPHADDQQ
jgi:hypothetical protein